MYDFILVSRALRPGLQYNVVIICAFGLPGEEIHTIQGKTIHSSF